MVSILTPLQPCTTAQVQLTALTSNQVAGYGAYFDWNGDGVFGPGEGYTGQIGTIATPSETKVIDLRALHGRAARLHAFPPGV